MFIAKVLVCATTLEKFGSTAELNRVTSLTCHPKPDTARLAPDVICGCDSTSAADRRPSQSGANSERATRLEPGSRRQSAQRSNASDLPSAPPVMVSNVDTANVMYVTDKMFTRFVEKTEIESSVTLVSRQA